MGISRLKTDGPWMLLILVVMVLVCAPLLSTPGMVNMDPDWRIHLAIDASTRAAILEEGRLPLWSPHLRGGYPLIGHPYEKSLSVFVLPVLLAGEVLGMKLNIALMLFLGAFGMYGLVRGPLGGRPLSATASALGFALSYDLAADLRAGDCERITFLALPLAMLLLLRAPTSRLALAGCALVLANVLALGTFWYVVMVMTLGLYAAWTAAEDHRTRQKRRLLPAVIAAIGLSLALSAAKVGALLHVLGQNIRPKTLEEIQPFSEFLVGLVAANPVLLPLAIAAAILRTKRFAPWIALSVFFVLLLSGGPLYRILWSLPVFGSMENNYYMGPLLFIVALLGGQLFNHVRNSGLRLAIAGALALNLAGIAQSCHALFSLAFPTEITEVLARSFASREGRLVSDEVAYSLYAIPGISMMEEEEDRVLIELLPSDASAGEGGFQVHAASFLTTETEEARTLRDVAWFNLREGIGTIDSLIALDIGEHAVPRYLIGEDNRPRPNPAWAGEATFPGGEGRVEGAPRLGHGVFTVDVTLERAGLLVLNQNYDRYWTSDSGTVLDDGGRLAVQLDAGVSTVVLRYRPWPMLLGGLLSALTFLGLGLFVASGLRGDHEGGRGLRADVGQ